MVARNKITLEVDYDDSGRAVYRFTGSQRQPTLNEIEEWIADNRPDEIKDYFAVCAIKCQDIDGGYQGFNEPEVNKTVEFWGYDGGSGDGGSCPICGHERDVAGSVCPVCCRPWG